MIVDFDTCTWDDKWVQGLSPNGKLLFFYLWTNSHKNLSGMYQITHKTICNETGLTQKQVEDTLSILYPKVIYDADNGIVFVVKHIRRQFLRTGNISPKVVKAISTHIHQIPKGHPFVNIFLNEYKDLNIEYQYPIDRVLEGYPYPPGVYVEVKGGGEGKGIIKGNNEKLKFKEFVYLGKEEHKKLVEEYGESLINEKIIDLNNGIGSKGYKYKSHYHTILSWIRKDVREGKLKLDKKEKPKESEPKPPPISEVERKKSLHWIGEMVKGIARKTGDIPAEETEEDRKKANERRRILNRQAKEAL